MINLQSPAVPLVRELGPNEAEVQRVMRELGLDYLQARNHVRGLELLRRMNARPPAFCKM